MNRFKGIRSDKVPEELWKVVCDIVQDVAMKTIAEEMQECRVDIEWRLYKIAEQRQKSE